VLSVRSRFALGAALVLLALALGPEAASRADAVTRVFLDGQSLPVYFSDGDSFRFLGGDYSGANTRLSGFNTLESYGPVHQWGDWHPYELFVNAKQATLNARRGVWHCTTEGERDTYGRILVDCPDLAVDQIRKGLAHAMQVDDIPQRPEYLRAQQEAIRERQGMWAHGVPDFVLTSLHSIEEDPERAQTYNRLVSTRDGHSEKWEHTDRYPECTWQCATVVVADEDRVRDVARRLREMPALAPAIGELSNLLLIEIADRYARLGTVPEWVTAEQQHLLLPQLEGAKRAGALGQPRQERSSCHLYVDFTRRYGRERPSCLRGRGVRP
jgi:endonuclease YncB( thermonuclease family)